MKEESKFVKLRGWDAAMAIGGVLFSYTATALLMAWPIAWLINHAFASSAIHSVFGSDRLSCRQCVMVFAIWQCATVKVRFPFTVLGKA